MASLVFSNFFPVYMVVCQKNYSLFEKKMPEMKVSRLERADSFLKIDNIILGKFLSRHT
jgi:hypothetical protein